MVHRTLTLVPYPGKGADALRPKTERDHELLVHLTGARQQYLEHSPVFIFESDDLAWVERLAGDHGWSVCTERSTNAV